MKEFLLASIGALVLSCLFNSVAIWMGILQYFPPYPIGSAMDEVKEGINGCKRDDFSLPEVEVTRRKKASGLITDIYDHNERGTGEFPYWTNN